MKDAFYGSFFFFFIVNRKQSGKQVTLNPLEEWFIAIFFNYFTKWNKKILKY